MSGADHAAVSDAEHLAKSVLAAKNAAGFPLWKPWAMDLADAVIALAAERERWRLVACNVKDETARAEAAEAERDRLREALEQIADMYDGDIELDGTESDAWVFARADAFITAHGIARAALGGSSE